jgi:hypothetical protein
MGGLSELAALTKQRDGIAEGYDQMKVGVLARKAAAIRQTREQSGGGELEQAAVNRETAKYDEELRQLEIERQQRLAPLDREIQRINDPTTRAARRLAASRDAEEDPEPDPEPDDESK